MTAPTFGNVHAGGSTDRATAPTVAQPRLPLRRTVGLMRPVRPTLVLVYWGIRGGGARYTFELARALGENDECTVIVSLNARNELLGQFRELASEKDIELDVRRFVGPGRAKAWFALFPGPFSFGNWCRRRNGRVIVTMGNPLSFPVALTLRASGVPLTHVVHDAVRHQGERSSLMHLSVRWAARLATNVVALSADVRNRLTINWHVPAGRVTVIPHGPFYAAEAEILRDAGEFGEERITRQVLFLGRILPYKGLALLLQAWTDIHGEFPDARLVVAGEGDLSPYAPWLQSPSIEVVNHWLDDQEIIDLMAGSALLVLPYVEASQSGVIGIAHSFSVPVLCTRVGGLVDQASPESDTLVAPTRAALAEGLRASLSRDSDYRKIGIGPTWQDIARAFGTIDGPVSLAGSLDSTNQGDGVVGLGSSPMESEGRSVLGAGTHFASKLVNRLSGLLWGRTAKGNSSADEVPQLFPPGHFYSPIVQPTEIGVYLDSVASRLEIPGIDLRLDAQIETLESLRTMSSKWPSGRHERSLRFDPDNDQFGPGDAICYFSMLGMLRPERVVEVGSGWSSALGLDAKQAHDTNTHFTFIEPYPSRLMRAIKAEDLSSTTIIRAAVQSVDLTVFDQLSQNDILFIDSTHVMKAGSDVQFLLGEVLPRLQPGVVVHIHDMFFPFEYPRNWVEQGRNWNELYAVKSFLQFNDRFEVLFWNHHLASVRPAELASALPQTKPNPGGGLWLRTSAQRSPRVGSEGSS